MEIVSLIYFSATNSTDQYQYHSVSMSVSAALTLHLPPLCTFCLSKVSSHSEPSSQSLSLQQPAQPPPPPPPPPQPQYGLPVPESRDKQLLFSDFEDLSASFRSLYKCVFEQSFTQQGGCCPSFFLCLSVHAFLSNIYIDSCSQKKKKKNNL